ncbi:HDOD domain-containing protein [Halioxenophilus aromaticivorans]
MTNARQLVANLSETLAMPPVYRRVRTLMEAQDANIDHYVEVVATDSSLAERVIRLANSKFLGYRRRAHNLKQAITLIGAVQVHDLLVGSLSLRAFSSLPPILMDVDRFWRGNIKCGILARNISRQALMPAKERLFTIGLLHDIGHVAMFLKIPVQTQQALAIAADTGQSIHSVEQQLLGFHYGTVGCELAQFWQLPDIYTDTIGNHMEPTQATRNRIEKAIINVARHLAMLPPDSNLAATDLDRCPGWRLLNLSLQQAQQLLKEAESWEEELFLTLNSSPESHSTLRFGGL